MRRSGCSVFPWGLLLVACVSVYGNSIRDSGFGYEILEQKMEELGDQVRAEFNATNQRILDLQRLLEYVNAGGKSVGIAEELRSCEEAPRPGIYRLKSIGRGADAGSLDVVCDRYNGSSWLVFQRFLKVKDELEFGGMDKFKNGNGKLTGEFWLGLEALHQITTAAPYELVLTSEDGSGNVAYVHSSRFQVGGESVGYPMTELGPLDSNSNDILRFLQTHGFRSCDNYVLKNACGDLKWFGLLIAPFRDFHPHYAKSLLFGSRARKMQVMIRRLK